MNKSEARAEHIGVINPYALAEVVLRKKINWRKVANPQKLLGDTLGHPYASLFDPKSDSPLYAGLTLDRASKNMLRLEGAAATKSIPRALAEVAGSTVWVDPGDFYEEGTELTDPVQGALGDCYFIAALASVAWARPYVIAQRTRATGPKQQDFVDMIEFYEGTKATKVEVAELLPLIAPGNTYIYARSSETGEIWPAIYEKAYAKWRTHDAGDKPNYAPLAGGDPVGAMSQLTGLTAYYQGNAALAAHDIWQKVRAHCISLKTFDPMVAWTYGTAPSPDVKYDSAHLVANHAYSVFGWQYVKNQEYIILRNPWGTMEATLNVIDTGNWVAWDAPYYGGSGFWRTIGMPIKNDGIFALRADTFKAYFAGFGWVKTPESPT
jgi:hypothetical protein